MNHRERVIATFNHDQPDRVPLDLMGNASMLLDQTYLRLRDYFGLTPIPPVRSGTTANYYDERILEKLDVDFRRIFLTKNKQNKLIDNDAGTFVDIWNICYGKMGALVNVVRHPLSGMTSVREIEAYPWPTADQMFTTTDLADKACRLYQTTDYALVARNPLSGGFLEHSYNLMGMAEFLMSLAAEPILAQCIIDHLLEIYSDVYTMFLDAVGPYVQMVEVSDDLGSQENLIISPQMYRQYIKPAEQKLYDLIHSKAPHAALFHHTDGAVYDLIPDLIEVGVNVLNPVQTSSKGMQAVRLKKTFGESIIFHGAIEGIEKGASQAEVIAEVRSRIDILGEKGGYVLAPCNHMVNVDPETVVAMYQTAGDYGRYA